MPNKIPYTYPDLLHEIYNYPTEFTKLILQMGYHKYHFYWCKERYYMALWSTINQFIDNPEKFTIEYHLDKETPDQQIKLLWAT
jgi:hypothetical protein